MADSKPVFETEMRGSKTAVNAPDTKAADQTLVEALSRGQSHTVDGVTFTGAGPETYLPVQDVDHKSKVCIVGFADGHRDKAPWDDPDMEYWGINRLHAVLPDKHWDRWFEIHDLKRFYGEDQEHQTFLKEANFPVYVRRQDMPIAAEWGWNTAEPFPHDELVTMFQPYFTNTISWLLAMAIAIGFEEIQMYGVDMAQDTLQHAEYRQQRPSCEWLIGIAQGRGIKVVMPPGSDLLKASHLYGFDSDEYRDKLTARLAELGQRKEQIRAEMTQHTGRAEFLQARISELDGAMQEVTYNLTNLVTPVAAPQEVNVG